MDFNQTIPAAKPPKKKSNPLLGPCIALGVTAGFLLLTTIGFAATTGSHLHAGAPAAVHTISVPGPVRTVTVTSEASFDACKTAYAQVVALLQEQTSVLQGVSQAASDGFAAVANDDPTALDDAGNRVSTYTAEEQSMNDKVNSIDAGACR